MRFLIGVAAALIAAGTAAAQDKPPFEQDLEKAIDRLYSDRFTESDMGRLELVEMGRKANARLIEELNKVGDPKDAKKRGPSAKVKRNLCEILGQSRDNSQNVIDALVARLSDKDEFGHTVAAAAAGALASIADEKPIPALITALNSKDADNDKWLKFYCIKALGILRAKEAAEAIIKALDDKGAAEVGSNEKQHLIAAAAADALGRLRSREAAEPLAKLLKSNEQNPYTQQTLAVHAARALERVTGVSRGSLEGDAATVQASLDGWRKWWDTEETRKNIEKTRGQLAEIAAAVEKYKAAHGEYPPILDYLKSKPADKPLTNYPDGGYYKGELKDAWGTVIMYNTRGDNGAPFDVISYGKGGKPWGGGDDADIWNHEAYRALKIAKTKKNIATLAEVLNKYKADNEKFPDKLIDLVKKPADAKKWEKAYVETVPQDGFDSAFDYSVGKTEGEPFDLKSWGSDLKQGGSGIAQDIWNHEKWKAERAKTSEKRLEALGKAIADFRKDQERFPEKIEDLSMRPSYAKSWAKAYTGQEHLKDGYENPWSYKVSADGASFDLASLGADGLEGGEGADADVAFKKK